MTITEFLSAFYPDEAEPIHLRSFDPKGLPQGKNGFAQKIETCVAELRSDKALQIRLKRINEKQGLYFVVNAGGDVNADITRINAIYCEMDMDIELNNAHLAKQHEMYDKCLLPPSIRVETRKSVHAYWLPSEALTNQQFLALQQGLIKHFKSDPAISNLARVMRVPFFNHVHYENGYHFQPITIHTCETGRRYSLEALQATFPYKPPSAYQPKYQAVTGRLDTLDDVKAECRARIMAMDSWTAHGKWGCANGICHNGEGDTGLRVDLASGAITCWSKCDLKTILGAFGLEIPKKDNRKFEYIPVPEQKSDLYQWLQARKYKTDEEKERIAIMVEHLPPDIAQAEYERQIQL